MVRRIAVIVLLVGALALVAAVAPWTMTSDVLRSAVSAQLKDLYGLELSVAGRSTVAFLPVPRLKFENITLTTANGIPVVRGGWLRGEFRVLPILAGRLDLSEVSLSDTIIELDVDADGRSPWNGALASLRQRFESAAKLGHVQRLVLRRTDLRVTDRRAPFETVLRDIDLVANWPSPDAPFDITGRATWRGEAVEVTAASFRPSALATGHASRIDLQVGAPLGRLTLSGDLTLQQDARFSGRAALETKSLRDFSRWSGVDLPLGHLIEAFALEGDMARDGQGTAWPTAKLTIGGDRFDGALSARTEGGRSIINGTLAAERLDLTGFLIPLAQARSSEGVWSSDEIDLGAQGGPDLDLRLSASTVRIGHMRADDLAANISVKPGRYEASVSRVFLNKGVAKGRAVLASAADGIEIKGQSSFDRLDLGSLLADLGSPRWIGGSAQGQVTFEGAGESAAEIVRRLHGRVSISVRQGELVGIGLGETLRRLERRPLSVPLDWRGGRTPFDHAYLNMSLADGAAEIADANLTAGNLRAALQGRVSLVDRLFAVKANVEGTPTAGPGTASTIVFDINGPWDDISIVPDVRPLIQRSDAAQPLFGRAPAKTGRGSSGPATTVQ